MDSRPVSGHGVTFLRGKDIARQQAADLVGAGRTSANNAHTKAQGADLAYAGRTPGASMGPTITNDFATSET